MKQLRFVLMFLAILFPLVGFAQAQSLPATNMLLLLESSERSGFAGVVTNDSNPLSGGPGILGAWSYSGETGIVAGELMCKAIGADHPCSYAELIDAEMDGQLDELKTMDLLFWVHRTVTSVEVNSFQSPPGAGGRCNDWTQIANHLADGEYAEISSGEISYFFDQDTAYTGEATDGHAGNTVFDGGPCNLARALLCCN